MAEASLAAELRVLKGKQAAKHLRNEGLIPGVLYGLGEEPAKLTIDLKELLVLLHTFGRNMIVDLSIAGNKKKFKAFIYEIQHDPMSGDILHVDLKHIDLSKKMHLSVAIQLKGSPYGVRNEGGILEHTLHALEISCLPTDIPDKIIIDVEDMHLGDAFHVSDIEANNFEILSDMSSTVVHVVTPKVVVEVEEEEVEEELVEGEESAEPEVIGEEE